MKHRIGAAAGFSIMLILLTTGAVMAYRSSTVRITNRIETGDIDIDILQNGQTEGAKKTLADKVIPGDVVPDEVSIRILDRDFYVRIKVGFADSEEKQDEQKWKQLDKTALGGIGEGWIEKGDYYYFTEPVRTGEEIPFLKSVSIPESWTEQTMDCETGLDITAEAVQAIHFIPDYRSEEPWGNTKIELCVHKNTGEEQQEEKRYQDLSVTLEGEAARLMVFPADFFSNLKELMPGDEISDSVHIQNHSNQKAELFFRTEEPEGLTEEQKELLAHLEFRMEKDGKELYRGTLQSQELHQEISLGSYEADEESELTFFISMPKEDQNWFAARDTMIHWVFYCDLPEVYGPKTGDVESTGIYLVMMAGTAGMILLLVGKKYRYRKQIKSDSKSKTGL